MTLLPLQTQEEMVAGAGLGAACHGGSPPESGHLALGPRLHFWGCRPAPDTGTEKSFSRA